MNRRLLLLARHILLGMSIAAVAAVVFLARQLTDIQTIAGLRMPAVLGNVSEDLPRISDPEKFRTVCLAIGKIADANNQKEDERYSDLVDLYRKIFRWALRFAAVAAATLLLAWVAAGAVLRHAK